MTDADYDDEDAEVADRTKRAICRDCDRNWSGSGVEAVGEAHSARYDHTVKIVKRTVYDGPADAESNT